MPATEEKKPKAPPPRPNLDSVTTIRDDGSHLKLHPADVSGRFTAWRRVFSLLLLAIYVGLPWIQINGYPAVFLDVAERRFHFVGFTFVTRDLWIMVFVVTGLGFSLFYVTSLFGRIWCGWACPYTVFLEHIFRRIERLVEGDAPKRRKLDAAPWTGEKAVKRIIKHGLFVLCAALIAHVFLAYFVSLPRLYSFMQGPPGEHLTAFGVVAALTIVLYFCFAWFREQFCIIVCPYGRIQSALTDDDTMIIGYDEKRGEPRGKASDPTAGDCVSCNRCIQVCPTGIDIRNGLQLECVGCAACVDACDAIMAKLKRPMGLIRYDSLNGFMGRKTRWLRPRTVVYTGMLLLGIAVAGFAMTRLHSADATVRRMQGMPYYVADDSVRNHFKVRLVNKRNEPVTISFSLPEAPNGMRTSGLEDPVVLPAQGEVDHPFVLTVPREHYSGPARFDLQVAFAPIDLVVEREIRFLGPDKRLFEEENGKDGSTP